MRPPGERGMTVSDGHADSSTPRHFTLYTHGHTVAHTYREALFTIFGGGGAERLQRFHQVLTQFRSLRSHLREGDPVPDSLLMGIGHAHNLLATLVRHNIDESSAPVEVVVRPCSHSIPGTAEGTVRPLTRNRTVLRLDSLTLSTTLKTVKKVLGFFHAGLHSAVAAVVAGSACWCGGQGGRCADAGRGCRGTC